MRTHLGQAPAVRLVELHWDIELGGQASLCKVNQVQIKRAYVRGACRPACIGATASSTMQRAASTD